MSRTETIAPSEHAHKHQNRKRKSTANEPTSTPQKRGRKADQKSQSQNEPEQKLHEIDPAIAQMSQQMLADHFAKTTRKHYKTSTPLEWEDQYVPSAAFRDTCSFTPERRLEHLPAFLAEIEGGKENLIKSVAVARPHTLVICPSGIRAADVTRQLRVFRTDDSAIAKLFAKHLKLKDTIAYVRKTSFGFGVGTPGRLKELVESGVMSVDGLERIVVDGSYLDEKKRGLWDMKELFAPMLEFLGLDGVKGRLGARAEVVVF